MAAGLCLAVMPLPSLQLPLLLLRPGMRADPPVTTSTQHKHMRMQVLTTWLLKYGTLQAWTSTRQQTCMQAMTELRQPLRVVYSAPALQLASTLGLQDRLIRRFSETYCSKDVHQLAVTVCREGQGHHSWQ